MIKKNAPDVLTMHGPAIYRIRVQGKLDAKLTCGIISKAFSKDGPDSAYENLGKLIIHDMKPHGKNSYTGGKIWDPDKDKTYKSKMTVKGDDLDVDGCISFVCIGEDWKRVKK